MAVYLRLSERSVWNFILLDSDKNSELAHYWVHKSSSPIPLFTACRDADIIKDGTYFAYDSAVTCALNSARQEGRNLASKLGVAFTDQTPA